MLEQCWNHSKQCRNNVAKVCCAKNRRRELPRVTSPLHGVACICTQYLESWSTIYFPLNIDLFCNYIVNVCEQCLLKVNCLNCQCFSAHFIRTYGSEFNRFHEENWLMTVYLRIEMR